MERIPRISSVAPLPGYRLAVVFETGDERIYDCTPLLARPEFSLLRDLAFFRCVRRDPGGYGVSWSDDIDLAEVELWRRGSAPGIASVLEE